MSCSSIRDEYGGIEYGGLPVGVVIRDALWTTSSSEGTGLDWERINRQLGVWGVPT